MSVKQAVKEINDFLHPKSYGNTKLGRMLNKAHQNNIVYTLYKQEDEELKSTLSLTKYEAELNKLKQKLLKKGESCTIDDYKEFKSNLIDLPIERYDIFADLSGITLSHKNSITLGDFTLYNLTRCYNELIKKYPNKLSSYLRNVDATLIETKVSARDPRKAYELARGYFTKFENVLRYYITIPSEPNTKVGIFSQSPIRHVNVICVSCTDVELFEWSTGLTKAYPFDKYPDFVNPKYGHKLWELITKKEPNEIESRISNAVYWYGLAMNEIDIKKGLILYCMSIEALVSNKGHSVKHQFEEFPAFINGNHRIERLKISNELSEVYDIRSNIVHGKSGKKEANMLHLIHIRTQAYELIKNFCDKEPVKSFTKYTELMDWIKEKRYS